MKQTITVGLLSAILCVLSAGCQSSSIVAQTGPSGTITYQTFYDDLSPYGTWIDYASYGHVWHPGVDGDFRPYDTNGNWTYSDEGWAWNSNYSWGWAPFHYGSWLYDDGYGWLWVPGYDWSPAWVTWGNTDDYYCWAPITPGVSIGLAFGSYRPHDFYWNVCDRAHIYDRDLGPSLLARDRIGSISAHINIINNFSNRGGHYYSRGPDVRDVERYTNRTITPTRFHDVQHARDAGTMKGNSMGAFRPGVANPQPNEFKRPDPSEARPLREGQSPQIGREQQHNNIQSLPTFKSQGVGFGRDGAGGGFRGGGGGFRGGGGGGGGGRRR
ncbi:MAG: DUF6600 domain-containing protein [Chitinophagaceae bacterium]